MEIKQIAMVGTGSMGSMMTLLFAEHGVKMSIYDPAEKNRQKALDYAKQDKLDHMVTAYSDYSSLCKSLSSPKVFFFSVPHGSVGDGIVDSLWPYLEKGDIIIDGSNEHWENTQRRQGKLVVRGVGYVGMGVSGGYQSARGGASFSPGGEDWAVDAVMPFLRTVAAKDVDGNPCVQKMGEGGAGHYVKMVHNGIEQGMMSALCEVWGIMNFNLGLDPEEISAVFEKWNKEGELRENFLIGIAVNILKQKDPNDKKRHILAEIQDKVTQDVDESEGTGVWTSEEGMRLHIPIPTITNSHQLRLASAYSVKRERVFESVGGGLSKPQKFELEDKTAFIEELRKATYAAFLSSFVQGLTLLARADDENKWGINFEKILAIWRGGCIIRSEAISLLFLDVYKNASKEVLSDPSASGKVGAELKKSFPALKSVVLKSMEADAIVPTLAGTLEWLKYSTTKEDLPTEFEEAELDYFGWHMFDKKGEDSGKPETGRYHFGWKPAKGIPEPRKVIKL